MSAIQDIKLKTIKGEDTSLASYKGKVLLLVNVASKCGLTPQYEALEKVYEQYNARGLEVLGFPANNFAGQEPGTDAEIEEFCSLTYSVKFPMFSKISVVGDDQHPLYAELIKAQPRAIGDPDEFREKLTGYGLNPNNDPDILWNFEKFLVDRDGKVVQRFAPTMTPDDPALIGAIESALG